MTDKAVILAYAQEWQTNDKPWREFEWRKSDVGSTWKVCSRQLNPLNPNYSHLEFRRKLETITVTMPVPYRADKSALLQHTILITCSSDESCDTALKAIHDAMGGRE